MQHIEFIAALAAHHYRGRAQCPTFARLLNYIEAFMGVL